MPLLPADYELTAEVSTLQRGGRGSSSGRATRQVRGRAGVAREPTPPASPLALHLQLPAASVSARPAPAISLFKPSPRAADAEAHAAAAAPLALAGAGGLYGEPALLSGAGGLGGAAAAAALRQFLEQAQPNFSTTSSDNSAYSLAAPGGPLAGAAGAGGSVPRGPSPPVAPPPNALAAAMLAAGYGSAAAGLPLPPGWAGSAGVAGPRPAGLQRQ